MKRIAVNQQQGSDNKKLYSNDYNSKNNSKTIIENVHIDSSPPVTLISAMKSCMFVSCHALPVVSRIDVLIDRKSVV